MPHDLPLECLRTRKTGPEHKVWARWMQQAAELATRFHAEASGDDPFAYGEAASIGFLATAAAKADLMALPEFAVPKESRTRGGKKVRGRCDLWIADDKNEWWFEAKQFFVNRGSDRDLERRWATAEQCARQVGNQGTAVAMLIASCWRLKGKGKKAPAAEDTKRRTIGESREEARAALERFAAQRQFAWRIGVADDLLPETYLFFDILKK